jgi:predicted ATPase
MNDREILDYLGNLPDNEVYLPKLASHMSRAGVVPFIGAGMSAPFGYPQWTPFLRKLAENEGLKDQVEAAMTAGDYETAAELVIASLGKVGLQDHMEANFGDQVLAGKALKGAVSIIPMLGTGPVFTTNFDRLLEAVFQAAGCPFDDTRYAFAAEAAVPALQENASVLLKVHGDWKDPDHRVLTRSEYLAAYGDPAAGLDLNRALPQLFYLLATRPLLFLGCSLKQDRTVAILKWVAGKVDSLHFAILEVPADDATRRKRRDELLESKIRPIWYPKGAHDKIEGVLGYLADKLPAPLRRRESKTETLPPSLTTFIGREQELEDVANELRASRLLTVVGPPGGGKTRLAIEVARRIQPEFEHTWFIELSQIAARDAELIPQRVATVLGIYKTGSDTPIEQLQKYLSAGKNLLIIDNSEHLVDAVGKLCYDLRQCAGLKILCTSRRNLNTPGEKLHQIQPLVAPHAEDQLDLAALSQLESVRLFLERSGKTLTANNSDGIKALCEQLEGIPLAIELAAALTKTLDIDQILERLNRPLNVLTGGAGGEDVRQWPTLAKAMDVSHELLNDAQSVFFRRLSVFRRGCRLEAAVAVCAAPEQTEDTVIQLLAELQAMSLIKAEVVAGRYRFRMLDFVRQYASELRDAAGERETICKRHASWCAEFAEKGAPELLKANQKRWLADLMAEADDFRAAISFSVDSHDAESGLRITGALWRMMEIRGYLSEGIDRLQSVLALPEAVDFPGYRAVALSGLGILYYRQGDIVDAEPCFTEALRLERALNRDSGIGNALNDLGNVAVLKTDFEAARQFFEECLAIQNKAGNLRDIAVARYNLGKVLLRQGLTVNAVGLLQDAVRQFEKAGNLREAAFARNGLALAAFWSGDLDEAAVQAQKSLQYREDLKDNNGVAETKRTLAAIRMRRGDYAGAYELLWASSTTCRELRNRLGLAETLELFARLAMCQKEPAASVKFYAAADRLRAELQTPVPPLELPQREQDLKAASAALGPEETERAVQPARLWDTAEALKYSDFLRDAAAGNR